jgi:hypothetical protein
VGENVLVAIIATIGVAVSSIAAALSAVAIARINATKTDVGQAKDQASKANLAAVAARDYSKPMGNGYADESRATWGRIEGQLAELRADQVQTNSLVINHLSSHADADVNRHDRAHEENGGGDAGSG